MPPLAVETARGEEQEPALGLVFGHLPAPLCANRVSNALVLLTQGELDPRSLMVVRGKSRLQGAMLSMLLPGNTGLVWPPQAVATFAQKNMEDLLVRHATDWLRQQGAKFGQALLLPEEASQAEPLLRNGYDYVTDLWYLRHELKREEDAEDYCARPPRGETHLSFESYRDAAPDLFLRTLLRSYHGSLDCPELNGVRAPADILQCHGGQGEFHLDHWWLVREENRAVGVLLLTRLPDKEGLDLAYLGVVPETRGRGLGRMLARNALAEARRDGASQLTLAVDRRNTPAWKMYLELGFQLEEERRVYLALWERETAA